MPQDFFADGFDDQQGIVFTKQQNQFLQAKLPFLDPRKTYQISMGNVLSLLKFAGLQPDVIKKIIQNSCKQGSKTITYDEMKKIFRGVALKQNRIQPSKINIQANIKTKLPIFHDEDDSDQQQQKPQPAIQSKPSTVQPTNQPPQQKQTLPVKSQSPVPVQPSQPVLNDPLKMFDQYWKTLPTKNNLIQGSHVKKICSTNAQNKNNLSKAWKLCNISQKGSLTKGQFFVFMNLINTNNIPQSLTKQMKQMINRIQQNCGYKKQQKQHKQKISTVSIPQSSKQVSISKSNVFDKFGDQSLFQKGSSKNQSSILGQKTSINNNTLKSSGIMGNASFGVPPPPPVPGLIKKTQFLVQSSKNTQKQLKVLTTNNQQLSSGLQTVEKYLSVISQNYTAQQQQIIALKQTQQVLSQRISNVCISMKNIITKQAQCISSIVQSMNEQNNQNIQRLKVLQNYTNQMGKIVDANINNAKNIQINQKKQIKVNYEKVIKKSQQIVNKISYTSSNQQYQQQNNHKQEKKQSPFKKKQQKVNNYNDSEQRNPFEDNDQHENNQQQSQKQSSNSLKQTGQEQQSQQQQQQQQILLQNLTQQQRLKMKQMQLIQMVNHITPIKQQQYAGVVMRITSMTQQQMNTLYSKLYTMYMQKQQQKAQQQRKQQFPNVDQFNTSQFIQKNAQK